MSKLTWDQVGERYYETGTDRGVIYPSTSGTDDTVTYGTGVAWNGLIGVTLSPSGAEITPLYANNQKYANLMSVEELGFTIEAYTYPEEFGACIGEKTLATGVTVGQQDHKRFGFCFRTKIGNDTEGTDHGYKIHIIYGALASPAEDANTTINDSPEAKTMSWECSTTPVDVGDNFRPTASITIDSTKVSASALAALEAKLYGGESGSPTLPMPNEVASIVGGAA